MAQVYTRGQLIRALLAGALIASAFVGSPFSLNLANLMYGAGSREALLADFLRFAVPLALGGYLARLAFRRPPSRSPKMARAGMIVSLVVLICFWFQTSWMLLLVASAAIERLFRHTSLPNF